MELSVRRLFLPGGTQSAGPYELRLPIFLQPLGGVLKNRSAAPASPPCFRRRRRSSSLQSAPLLFESTRAHEKTAGVEIHWRFSSAQMSDSHRWVDSNSSEADCNDDERRQRRKQRGVVGAAASDTQARRSGCWVPQPVRLRRKQGGEAGTALRFFKAPPRGCRKIGKRNS